MSVDLFLNVLAVIALVLALVFAGMWLLGVDREATSKVNRRRWLLSAALSAILAVLFALTADWIIAAAFGLTTLTELGFALVPDLPDRLRTRPG